jgi:hypothetical protein
MEQSKEMEYESPKASSDVLKPRNIYMYIYVYVYVYMYIQSVPGGKDLTSGECSLGQTIPI